MSKFYLSTALVFIMGSAALAQETKPATTDVPSAEAVADDPQDIMASGLIRASALEDIDVYTLDPNGTIAWDESVIFTDVDPNWEKIGEIEDVVVDTRQNVAGVIAEVGGFLGIGEKEVFLTPDEMTFIVTRDEVVAVSALSKDALEEREEVAEDMYRGK